MIRKYNFSLLQWFLTLSVLSLLFAACEPAGGTPVASTSGITTWLDQPITGAVLPLASFTLRAHARDTSGPGIIEIDFKVNDVPLGAVSTDAGAALASAELAWNPSAPGTYHIEAWGVNSAGEKVPSAVATVCVTDANGGGCLGQGAAPATTQAPAMGGIVQGVVYSEFNGNNNGSDPGEGPLDGVSVALKGSLTGPQIVTTAGDGAFSFTGLPAGTCQVTVAKPDWFEVGTFPAGIGYPANAASDPALPTAFSIFMSTQTTVTTAAPQTCEQLKNCTATPTPTPTLTFTATKAQAQPTATATPTPSATPIPQVQVSFTADSTNLNAGQCTFLHWNVQFATAVFLDGAGVAGVDQRQVCPTVTTTFNLHVEAVSGNVDQGITINVTPPTNTPPPADTSGPSINKPFGQPNPSAYGGSCAPGETTTTFQANVTDPSGVGSVQIFYRYENGGKFGGWNAVSASDGGSGNYSASIDNNTGNQAYGVLGGVDGMLSWYVLAQDTLGNPTQSGTQGMTIQYCIG